MATILLRIRIWLRQTVAAPQKIEKFLFYHTAPVCRTRTLQTHIMWMGLNRTKLSCPNQNRFLLQEMRLENDFYDVTLACDEQNFIQGHKVILSASSPYFKAILRRSQPNQHPILVWNLHMTKQHKSWKSMHKYMQAVWPDLVIFESSWWHFSYKMSPNVGQNFWAVVKNGTLFRKLLLKLLRVTFYSNIWSRCMQATITTVTREPYV